MYSRVSAACPASQSKPQLLWKCVNVYCGTRAAGSKQHVTLTMLHKCFSTLSPVEACKHYWWFKSYKRVSVQNTLAVCCCYFLFDFLPKAAAKLKNVIFIWKCIEWFWSSMFSALRSASVLLLLNPFNSFLLQNLLQVDLQRELKKLQRIKWATLEEKKVLTVCMWMPAQCRAGLDLQILC